MHARYPAQDRCRNPKFQGCLLPAVDESPTAVIALLGSLHTGTGV